MSKSLLPRKKKKDLPIACPDLFKRAREFPNFRLFSDNYSKYIAALSLYVNFPHVTTVKYIAQSDVDAKHPVVVITKPNRQAYDCQPFNYWPVVYSSEIKNK